jgi:sulfate transport system substrate-binding protein
MKQWIVRCLRDGDWVCRLGRVLGLTLLVSTVIWGRAMNSGASPSARLVVYASSTQEEVMSQCIFPGFEAAWESETGQRLEIDGVFGASETLAGQINLGAPADVALLSNARSVTHLKIGRQVRANRMPEVYARTPVVIVVRPGNPHAIQGFADLAQPGLKLMHADPRTSGAGQQAVLAEYASALPRDGGEETPRALRSELAKAQLEAIWRNVRLLGDSARSTMTLFELGAGDALVTHEHEALLFQQRGIPLEVVMPPRTLVAQHWAVIVDANVTPRELPVAEAFLDYLLGESGQHALACYHLRPANAQPGPDTGAVGTVTVDALGGWRLAYSDIVEGIWEKEIQPGLRLESFVQVQEPGER